MVAKKGRVPTKTRMIMATRADNPTETTMAGADPMAKVSQTNTKIRDTGARMGKENQTEKITTTIFATIAKMTATMMIAKKRTGRKMTEGTATEAEEEKGKRISTKRIRGTVARAAAMEKDLSTARQDGTRARKRAGAATYRQGETNKTNQLNQHPTKWAELILVRYQIWEPPSGSNWRP